MTGAGGFLGSSLCLSLERHGFDFVRAVRSASVGANAVAVGDIGPDTDWASALQACHVVVHLAARVHVMHDVVADPLAAFRQVNTAGSIHLARQAAQAGVRRFVYVSSIKVNGEATSGRLFTEADPANPQDPYAISKYEAELGLWQVADDTGMELVILRPPLVYGPGVKANFYRMLKMVDKGIPLPFSSINNRRSMIYLGNLVDALIVCSTHPAAAGKTYLVSDGEDVSTPELLRRIAQAMGKQDSTWPVPQWMLHGMGRLVGKTAEIGRLTESLQVDSSAIREQLGWVPPYSMAQGLSATVAWYREQVRGQAERDAL